MTSDLRPHTIPAREAGNSVRRPRSALAVRGARRAPGSAEFLREEAGGPRPQLRRGIEAGERRSPLPLRPDPSFSPGWDPRGGGAEGGDDPRTGPPGPGGRDAGPAGPGCCADAPGGVGPSSLAPGQSCPSFYTRRAESASRVPGEAARVPRNPGKPSGRWGAPRDAWSRGLPRTRGAASRPGVAGASAETSRPRPAPLRGLPRPVPARTPGPARNSAAPAPRGRHCGRGPAPSWAAAEFAGSAGSARGTTPPGGVTRGRPRAPSWRYLRAPGPVRPGQLRRAARGRKCSASRRSGSHGLSPTSPSTGGRTAAGAGRRRGRCPRAVKGTARRPRARALAARWAAGAGGRGPGGSQVGTGGAWGTPSAGEGRRQLLAPRASSFRSCRRPTLRGTPGGNRTPRRRGQGSAAGPGKDQECRPPPSPGPGLGRTR